MIINYDINNRGGGGNGFSLESLGFLPFDTATAYSIGQVVIYNNSLYQFTGWHTGEWDDDDAAETTVEELINKAGLSFEELGFSRFSVRANYHKGDIVIYLKDGADVLFEALVNSASNPDNPSEFKETSVAELIKNSGGASAEGCLRYDEAQDLTTEQQAQAKENLGIEEPEPQEQADWNETDTTDPAFIKNKPTIPTVNNPTVTINQGGTTKGKFTLNQSSAATINLEAGGSEPVIVEIYFDWGVGKQVKRTDLEAAIQKHMNNGAPIVLHLSDSASGIYSDSYELVVYVHSASTGFQIVISQGLNGSYNKYTIDQSSGTWITPEHYSIQADWNEANTSKPSFILNKPTIPQPENHQLLKSALSEPMGCSANTWATLAELTVPEDGAYQVSASARMLPADQSAAFKTATVSIELGTDAAGYTEVMEMTLPRPGEYGTLSVPVNASNGQKLRLRAISEANFYAQASPSTGKASATFIAAVRIGAIYQE